VTGRPCPAEFVCCFPCQQLISTPLVSSSLKAAQGASAVPQPQAASQPTTQATPPPPSQPSQERGGRQQGGADTLTPEFFTSVVQGVLSSMMGSLNAQQGSTESIADFIQRLSGTSNIFEPGADGALGMFTA